MSVEMLSIVVHLYEKLHFKWLAIGNDLEYYSRSLEMTRFDSPYMSLPISGLYRPSTNVSSLNHF